MRYSGYLLRRSPLVIVGIIIISFILIVAVAGPFVAPYPEFTLFKSDRCPSNEYGNPPCAPYPGHPFGTDQNGFDVYSRLLYAARLDVGMAFAVVALAGIVGLILGALAGYLGGIIDEVIMRVTDVFLAFPGLVLAIAIAAVLGPSFTSLFIALLAGGWVGYVRLIRAQVLSVREYQFVEAARAVGAGNRRIVFRHIIPHVVPQMFVYTTIDLGGVILTLAGLGFLGLSGSPITAEWGAMISNSLEYLFTAPWTVFVPGAMILLTSLGFNLVGDGLRDILDPRLRR